MGPIFLVSIGVGMALALLVTSRFAFVPGVLAAFIGIGFATHVSDAPCPRCGEKFFGDPLRTFTASECKACGLAPN